MDQERRHDQRTRAAAHIGNLESHDAAAEAFWGEEDPKYLHLVTKRRETGQELGHIAVHENFLLRAEGPTLERAGLLLGDETALRLTDGTLASQVIVYRP